MAGTPGRCRFAAPTVVLKSHPRTLSWSLRRERWFHHAATVAPLLIAITLAGQVGFRIRRNWKTVAFMLSTTIILNSGTTVLAADDSERSELFSSHRVI